MYVSDIESLNMSGFTEPIALKASENVSENTEDIPKRTLNEEKRPNKSFWRTVQRYVWDDPDKPAYEKRFLLKLDIFVLSYTCLGYFCKNLYVLFRQTTDILRHPQPVATY